VVSRERRNCDEWPSRLASTNETATDEFVVIVLLLLVGGLSVVTFAVILWTVFARPEVWRSGPDPVAWAAVLLSLIGSGVIVLLGGWRGWSGLQQLR
jgi:hypothetical protein